MSVIEGKNELFFLSLDYEIQKQMANLIKERDCLSQSIKTYRDWFDAQDQLIAEIKGKYCKDILFM